MKILLFLSAVFVVCYGKECEDIAAITGPYDNEYENKIILDTHDGVVATLNATNLTSALVVRGNYLSAELKDGELIISTTEDYKFFEEREESDYYYKPSVGIYIDVTCIGATSRLEFLQPINDTNNHVPFFNREVYNYKFGMNLSKGFALTELVDVYATDIDMLTENIEFSIEPKDILKIVRRGTVSNTLGKTHEATVTTLKDLQVGYTQTFTITATDKIRNNAYESKTGTAQLILQLVEP